MSAINTGYTNYYSGPAAATSAPANFGPGQIKSDNDQANSQSKAQEAAESERKSKPGYTTATRGGQ